MLLRLWMAMVKYAESNIGLEIFIRVVSRVAQCVVNSQSGQEPRVIYNRYNSAFNGPTKPGTKIKDCTAIPFLEPGHGNHRLGTMAHTTTEQPPIPRLSDSKNSPLWNPTPFWGNGASVDLGTVAQPSPQAHCYKFTVGIAGRNSCAIHLFLNNKDLDVQVDMRDVHCHHFPLFTYLR